jgi:hypothetical protein
MGSRGEIAGGGRGAAEMESSAAKAPGSGQTKGTKKPRKRLASAPIILRIMGRDAHLGGVCSAAPSSASVQQDDCELATPHWHMPLPCKRARIRALRSGNREARAPAAETAGGPRPTRIDQPNAAMTGRRRSPVRIPTGRQKIIFVFRIPHSVSLHGNASDAVNWHGARWEEENGSRSKPGGTPLHGKQSLSD